MTEEQIRQSLGLLGRFLQDGEYMTRQADDMAQGDLHQALDPQLRGHISLALQHLQQAQAMLEEMGAEEPKPCLS